MSKGAKDGFRGNQYSNKVVNPQSEDLPKDNRTVTRIAKEHGIGKSSVERAEKFAKGLDAANVLCIRIDRA